VANRGAQKGMFLPNFISEDQPLISGSTELLRLSGCSSLLDNQQVSGDSGIIRRIDYEDDDEENWLNGDAYNSGKLRCARLLNNAFAALTNPRTWASLYGWFSSGSVTA